MQNDAFDLAFARHVKQIGLVTPEQISSAMEAQSTSLQKGTPVSFSEVLVQLAIITPTQKDSLEKKVKEQQAGAHQLGPYKLLKKLGEGGMGAVYLAVDPATQKNVALKVLPRHYGSNPEFVKRFRREAETATRLKHPNIVGAFATGEDLGYHFYVMEFCDGETLDALIKRELILPIPRALGIVLQAAQGLHYAHQQGVLHRDIKPSNLFQTKEGLTRILDLGLSKMVDDPTTSFKTVTGAVLGTPHYISPEQAQGEKEIDGRTDIYSLGATFYHLLTGQTPFDGTTVLEILSKQVNSKLPNPQDLREDMPDSVAQVLQRMMAKAPRDRYPNCGALITDLQEVMAGREPKSQVIAEGLSIIAPSMRRSAMLKKRVSTGTRRMATVRSTASQTPWIVAGGVAAAVLVVLIFVLMGKGEDAPPPPAPRKTELPVPPTAHTHHADPVKPPTPAPRPVVDPLVIEKPVVKPPPPPPPPPDKPETPSEALTRKIRESNPNFDGPVQIDLDGDKIVAVTLFAQGISSLEPLRFVPTLRRLDVSGRWDSQAQREYRSELSDIAPLRGLPIEELRLHHSEVRDLSPIRGMPLRVLDLSSAPVTDLGPIQGMKLVELNTSYTGVKKYDLIQGMPIEELLVNRTPFEPALTKGLPLKTFALDILPEHDLTVLAGIKTLTSINGERAADFLKKMPLLPLLPMTDEAWKGAVHLLPLVVTEQDTVTGVWKLADGALKSEDGGGQSMLSLPYKPGEEYALRVVFTPDGDKPDVSQVLSRGGKAFQWINGGWGNTLFGFAMVDDTLPDASPYVVRKPQCLEPRRTSTAIIEVRKDAILAHVNGERLSLLRPSEHKFGLMTAMKVPDPTRLALQTFQCTATFHAVDVMELKGKGTLVRTSRPPIPVTPEAAAWKNAVDLLALVEPSRDSLSGTWKKEGARLISEPSGNGTFRLPYEPPAEYDFRIIFTRTNGKCATAQFFPREGRCAFYEMGGYGNATIGFANVNGQGSNKNATGSPFACKDGVRYVSTVQVRRDRATAYLDDKKVAEWVPSMGTLSCEGEWSMDVPTILGLGNCDTLTVFEAILVREVTGKGRIRGTFATTPDPAALKAIASTSGDEQLKRVLAKLRELNPKLDTDDVRSRIENERLVELAIPTGRVFDIWPVRALGSLKKLDLGDEKAGVLSDISSLKGMKLQELGLANTRVYDLAALQGMPLVRLQLQGTPVKDLTALKPLPLVKLDCDRTAVTDWTPLKGHRSLKTVNDMPLSEFLKSR